MSERKYFSLSYAPPSSRSHLISSSAFNLVPVSVSSVATLPQPMHMHRFYSISGLVGWIDFMCMYNRSIKCFWVRACIANVRSNSFNESHSIGMLTVQWTCSNMSKEFGSRKIRTDVFCSDALALSLSLSLSFPLSHSHFWLSIYSNLSKMPNITRASYIQCFKFDSMMVLKFLCWSLWFVPKWNHHAFGIGLLSYVRLVGEKGTIEVQEKKKRDGKLFKFSLHLTSLIHTSYLIDRRLLCSYIKIIPLIEWIAVERRHRSQR